MNVLGEIGGRNIDECVMKFIISDTLTTKLNLSGRNNKRAFGPTNLLETVYSKYFFFHISLSIYLSVFKVNTDTRVY